MRHPIRSRLLAAAALLAALPATGHAYVIAPGAAADFPFTRCTLNFVFDGVGEAAGRVFVGSAAHCASGPQPGDEVRMGGDPVQFGEVIGRVVAVGDYNRPDENPSVDDDWALIEVDRAFHRDVDPAVRGHAEVPRRVVATTGMSAGDVLQFSGHGVATEQVQPVREDRQGQWVGGDAAGYDAFAPLLSNGDSGGPVIDVKTGGALGVVSTALRGFCGAQCTLEGPTITHMLAEAAERGLPVRLRPAGAGPPPPSPEGAGEPAPQPAGQAPAPAAEPPARARLRVAPSGRGCVRGGRITVRLRATAPLASARLAATGRRPVVVGGRAVRRPVRLRGLRGRRVRVSVSARTRAGERVVARRTFAAC